MRSAATELSPAWSNSLASEAVGGGGKNCVGVGFGRSVDGEAASAAIFGGRQLAKVSLSVPSGRWARPIITVKGC